MVSIFRTWYNGSYTMAAKPIKSLEMHYTMLQFLIIKVIPFCFPWQAEAARNVASQNVPSNFKDLIQNLVSFENPVRQCSFFLINL